MAAAKLGARRRRGRRGRLTPWRVYLAIWSLTVCSGLLVAEFPGASALARSLLGARLGAAANPPPSLAQALALAAHNLPIAIWPLLLGALGAERHWLTKVMADCLVGGSLLASVLPVGAALGAYGTPLLAYLPQLPLEWAGLAIGASGWLRRRRETPALETMLRLAALAALLMLCAGALETWCVPHR